MHDSTVPSEHSTAVPRNVASVTRGPATIERAFQAARSNHRCALITYLTLGYPSPQETLHLIPALQAGGADLIELGVPFSDPVADGPVIQGASHQALSQGITPAVCLEMAAALRRDGIAVPLVLMGYYNPILSYGLDSYARDCAAAGVDGLIVPDLPPEEAEPLRAACRAAGLALIFLVAPTTPEPRMARIAALTEGFLYVVSRLGTTGIVQGATPEPDRQLTLARRYAHTPVAVGFGISRPEQARSFAAHADGVIVGSAVVQRAMEGVEVLRSYVRSLHEALVFRPPA